MAGHSPVLTLQSLKLLFSWLFLKPLSVALPFAARFTNGGDSEPCGSAFNCSAKAKTVTVAK
jgi:hypothetical protein